MGVVALKTLVTTGVLLVWRQNTCDFERKNKEHKGSLTPCGGHHR